MAKPKNLYHKLDILVLEVWTKSEALAKTPLTISQIVERLEINVSRKKVEEIMDQYVRPGMFEEIEQDGTLAYKPVSYTTQLDGLWNRNGR